MPCTLTSATIVKLNGIDEPVVIPAAKLGFLTMGIWTSINGGMTSPQDRYIPQYSHHTTVKYHHITLFSITPPHYHHLNPTFDQSIYVRFFSMSEMHFFPTQCHATRSCIVHCDTLSILMEARTMTRANWCPLVCWFPSKRTVTYIQVSINPTLS